MPSRKWNNEDLKEAVATSTNWSEVFEKLGISVRSESGMSRVRNHAKDLGIDCTHFVAKSRSGRRKHSSDYVFRKGIEFNTTTRRYFVESVEYKCSMPECGLSEWMGQRITLQVDHIDGDSTNNTLDNLRLVCPNCHAQTETWGVPKAHRKVTNHNV